MIAYAKQKGIIYLHINLTKGTFTVFLEAYLLVVLEIVSLEYLRNILSNIS